MSLFQSVWASKSSVWRACCGRQGRRKPQRSLATQVAALETRLLPSGTVTATLSRGVLTIQGDAADNAITVAIENKHVVISAYEANPYFPDPTTIVGVAAADVTAIVISLEGGNDILKVEATPSQGGAVLNRLQVTMGAGRDEVDVSFLKLTGSLTIDTGLGQDQVSLMSIQVQSVNVTTGSEDDRVGIGGLSSDPQSDPLVVRGTMTIDTGADRDRVGSWGKVLTGTTVIRTGTGDDQIDLTSYGVQDHVQFGHLRIDTGSEMDSVALSGLQFRSVSIDTAAGFDAVYLGHNDGSIEVLGPLTVSMGDGNDQLHVGGLTMAVVYLMNPYNDFRGQVHFSLGNGSDLLRVDTTDFSRAATFDLGDGRDIVEMGHYTGGLMFNGPLTLDTGKGGDKVTIGLPGVHGYYVPNLIGFTDFNGPVTVRGSFPATTIDWYSDNAKFNDRLRLNGAVMTEHRIDRLELLDSPTLTVTNLRTATFRETELRSFITGYRVTRDARGVTSLIPIITKVKTGITLTARAAVSADRREVTIDLKFTKVDIGTVETRQINTPLGPQTIELPQIVTLSVDTRVVVPDGGTMLASGLKQTVQTLKDGVPRATSRDLQLLVTPRIITNFDPPTGHPLQVTLELRLIEMLDFNVLSYSQPVY